jgi:hypothetical protein
VFKVCEIPIVFIVIRVLFPTAPKSCMSFSVQKDTLLPESKNAYVSIVCDLFLSLTRTGMIAMAHDISPAPSRVLVELQTFEGTDFLLIVLPLSLIESPCVDEFVRL